MHGAFEGGKGKFLLCQHGIPLLPSCARAYDHQQGEEECACHGVCVCVCERERESLSLGEEERACHGVCERERESASE
jgi:hypothetical protein